jgi:RNA polymerase sigma-70 factor (ECF subfamily)
MHQIDEATLRRLVGLCAVLVGPAAADDLAQDTLVAALRSGREPAAPEALHGWLAGVARNVARRHWRARTRELPVAFAPGEVAAGPDAADDVGERRVLLAHRALGRLPGPGRSLLTARLVDGRATSEIADQLGLSASAVSMRLTRARAALRQVITDDLADDARSAGIRIGHSGWRPTPLWCTECGNGRLESRRADDQIAFRCTACASHPGAIGSAFRLGNRTFAHLFGTVTQPAAIVRRAATWSHGYFGHSWMSGQVPCTACGHLARLVPYRRTVPRMALRHRRGLHVRCDACGETVSTSLGGLLASLPEARELQRTAGRVRATETVPTHVDGQPALVVGQRAVAGTAGVEMVVAADTLRPIDVRTTR